MSIITHAEIVYMRAVREYSEAVEREAADKASAARDKTPMSEHYWQRAHTARLKLMAATAIFEALSECSEA
jgi:hypothetical protein